MGEEKRPYKLKARAKAQDETRRRIVEATMQLHEEIGPRATTISAIADRAGVQRLTVYRHFPDETAVFQACTAHWLSLNPPPDPSAWSGIADPRERLHTALAAFYTYYSHTQRMWRVLTQAGRGQATLALEALDQLHLEPGATAEDLWDLLEDARTCLEVLLETVRSIPSHCRLQTAWGLTGPDAFDRHVRWSGARIEDILATLRHALAA